MSFWRPFVRFTDFVHTLGAGTEARPLQHARLLIKAKTSTHNVRRALGITPADRKRRRSWQWSSNEVRGVKITFLGAAGEVTGSQHLIETANLRVLLDCGFFQGRRADSRRKNERFRCDPGKLDGVILSHAHIDHSGNLPGLFRAGFRGPVFCTPATADVASIRLRDSARIQEEDARYMSRHLEDNAPPLEPLYTEDDAQEVARLFEPLEYGEWHELSPEFRLRFSDAGHILGSAICEMQIQDRGEMRRVVFTGDLGRRDVPILRDPQPVPGCDVLICESTYGNRVHPPAEDIRRDLLRIIRDAVDSAGKVIIPAFSLGRTQNVVYFLNELHQRGDLPRIPIFVDSPLSVRLTEMHPVPITVNSDSTP